LASAGNGGLEFCGGEHAVGAAVTGGEMLFDSLLLGVREFSVDESTQCVGTEMVRVEMLGELV
jgi:hypothetical protein